MKLRIAPALAALSLAVLLMANCHNGDVIPPEGATIDLAAIPASIVTSESSACVDLLRIASCGTSDVVATVSSPVGVPLEGQDVRFSNTAGLLFQGTIDNPQNVANLPVRTDKFGNAHVTLISGSTTTVNARSGKATGSLTLNVTSAVISRITLVQDRTSSGCVQDPTLTSCDDEVCFVATAVDPQNQGIPGVLISFTVSGITPSNLFFVNPTSATSSDDPAGVVNAVLKGDSTVCPSTCGQQKCNDQTIVVRASTTGGIVSDPVTISIGFP